MSLLADRAFRFKRFFLGRLRVRRTQLYCVGTAKSGTHSICKMFSRNVAASHEPQALKLIEMFFEWQDQHIGDTQMRDWIRARDGELALEVDSSWLNLLILDFLAAEFPHARFVLTIRDCYSWLNSEFRRVLHRPSLEPQRIKLRKHLYDSRGAVHAPEEQVLKETGLFTVDGYLSRWAEFINLVLDRIPKERLLIVRTEEIGRRAFEIADFAGLPRHTVRMDRTWEYQNPVQRKIIGEIDRNFLEAKVARHCRPLMDRFFPEIKTLDDARI